MATMDNETKVIDKSNAAAFLNNNRKYVVNSIIAAVVVIIGIIAFLCILDFVNKKAILSLENLITSYDDLKSSFSNTEKTEDVDKLLLELTDHAKKYPGYAAARAWFMAGNIYKERNEWDMAEDAWNNAAKKGNKTHLAPIALFNAAVAAEEQDDIEGALKYYDRSLAISDFPDAAHAQFSIGRLQESKDDKALALQAYRLLIEKWPNETNWTNLAHSRIVELEL
jgi:tetratricopeptide (TPR) repeat protein